MAGIKTLDERHKKLAEAMLRGRSRTQLAEELGVTRATLYVWAKDPLFQKYAARLAEDMQAARMQRLLPVVMGLSEVVDAKIAFELQRVGEEGAPGLTTLVDCLRKVVELERVDRGQPSNIVRSESDTGEPATPTKTLELVRLMDRWSDNDPPEEGEAVEPEPAPEPTQVSG